MNNHNGNVFQDYSSKIKKVYVELHDYKFYHGSSETSDKDDRFIGRRENIEKLKAILTRSQTKSGVYLITGHRGMGKSSFVSKVIQELSPSLSFSQYFSKYLSIFIYGVLNVLLLTLNGYGQYYYMILTFISLACLLYYSSCDLKVQNYYSKNSMKKSRWKYFYYKIKIFLNNFYERTIRLVCIFNIETNKLPKNRLKYFAQNIFLSSILFVILGIILNYYNMEEIARGIGKYLNTDLFDITHRHLNSLFPDQPKYIIKQLSTSQISDISALILSFIFIFFIIMLIVANCGNRIYQGYRFSTEKINLFFHNRKNTQKKPASLFNHFITYIENKFNHINRIYIRINLGYDDLKPIDVFRLISKKIRDEYKKHYKAFGLPLQVSKIIIFFVIFFLASILYKIDDIRLINENIKEDIHFTMYFPSQLADIDSANKIMKGQFDVLDYNPEECYAFKYAMIRLTVSDICKDRIQNTITAWEIRHSKYYMDAAELGNFQQSFYSVVFHLDLFVFTTYNIFRQKLTQISGIFPFYIFKSNIDKMPYRIDYLFWFYMLLLWLIMSLIIRSSYRLSLMSHAHILKKMDFLNDLIESRISYENESQMGLVERNFLLKFLRRRKQTFYKADVREIESKLIEILESIEKIPAVLRPEFILIFDELDKIEPVRNVSKTETEIENAKQFKSSNGFHSLLTPEETRKNQNAILNLLSSMKYFLTSAKAKFIFIAGQEMYEAYLADVSRNKNSIDSIFHKWISVESFYTDYSDGKRSDINSMTEWYVCQFLFPKNKPPVSFTLREYEKYLVKSFPELNENNKQNKTNHSRIIAKQKREKVIRTLCNFITYLNHMSNGSPKKITSFFEKFVTLSDKEHFRKYNPLVVGKSSKNFYLAFDYFKQYEIGMIHFLINPIALSINNQVKEYSDKLLISSSFLVDHLFKFHRDAFSWRNLELAPEIIDIHKTPELRGFIGNIMDYLSQTHLQSIVSGLFTFKFPKRISMELAFLSKISEEISAAFNFTLDESLPVKDYHENLLRELEERYQNVYGKKRNKYIHSIAMLHMVLGDLKYYDEDYSGAIIEYMDSIQILRNDEPKHMEPSKIIIIIRSMLKLGLAFEKRQTFNSAFLTYGELTSMIIGYRDIDLSPFGLIEKWDKNEKWPTEFDWDPNKKNWLVKGENLFDKEYHQEFLPWQSEFIINSVDKDNTNDTEAVNAEDKDFTKFRTDDFLDRFRYHFTPLKEKIFFKLTTFEGIRLMYQPLIAKFQMIEKSNLGGITNEDILRLEAEFRYIVKAIKVDEKYLIMSEFWNKAGDILYYKNGLLHFDEVLLNSDNKLKTKFFKPLFDDCNASIRETTNIKGFKLPCRACHFYYKSLNYFYKNYLCGKQDSPNDNQVPINEILYSITEALLVPNFFTTSRSNSYKALASILSDIGNLFLSCSCEKNIVSHKYIITLHNFMKLTSQDKQKFRILCIEHRENNNISLLQNSTYKIIKELTNGNKLEFSILCFVMAAYLYKKSTEHKDYSRQMEKIIYLFKDYFSNHIYLYQGKNSHKYKPIYKFLELVLKKTIKGIYTAYKYTHKQEIHKLKEIFSQQDDAGIYSKLISLKRLSVSNEVGGIIITFIEMILRYGDARIEPINLIRDKLQIDYFNKIVVSPYTYSSNIFNRVADLKFKLILNFRILESIMKFKEGSGLRTEKFIYRMLFFDYYDEQNTAVLFKKLFDTKFRSYVNYYNSGKIFFEDLCTMNEIFANYNIFELISFLITDSIHCAFEIIRHSNVYGINFALNHSYIARIHDYLFTWASFYKIYLISKDLISGKIMEKNEIRAFFNDPSTTEERNIAVNNIEKIFKDSSFKTMIVKKESKLKNIDIIKELEKLIDNDNLNYINPNYQADKAINHYYAAMETHTEGKAYKDMIQDMYYLNDDFNDNLFHFSVATERYRLNTCQIKKRIEELKKVVQHSSLFDYEKYIDTKIS